MEIEGPVKPPELPKPVYQYGAVINPVTNELYPVMVYENGKEYISPAYEEEINQAQAKPTALGKDTFDWATFISGLEFDDSLSNQGNYPLLGNLAGIAIGGITAYQNSWEHLYMDVHYYKEPITGQKQARILCGESNYINTFKDWPTYGIPVSVKSLHSFWSGANAYEAATWSLMVDAFAKSEYGRAKGITPDNSYQYDVEYTLDSRRAESNYVSQIFFGKDGKMYEYATIYPGEKMVIVVKEVGFMGVTTVIEQLDVTPLLNRVTELPADKAALFTVEKQ